ncbi:hypothetical protein [Rufibacter tibetensis]|uniref:Uncharacterized protein n=1 Tax=Rufibacter tibetensis TaxID=512763 RepID=A0A0P0CVR2_9BACT|nr:hypothetical protein [Rufibacter tibetensis]ALJ00797.1 hypothetical protein DC20_19675 [Rufibacter tibetensis]
MKKLLILLFGIFLFGCGNTANEQTEKDIDIQAGDEVRPQLEYESDTVGNNQTDTTSSTVDRNQ